MGASRTVETQIPARLDRLPWGRFHWMIVVGLGITWLLDGLEVTLAGSLAGILKDPRTLGMSDVQVGASATAYLVGAVIGALVFGWATDRFGRKKLFLVTLALYLLATAATALSWSAWAYFVFRFFTGMGIGGEYAAVNSAIDELIPARVRGRVDLAINASFWIGAALGATASVVLLKGTFVSPTLGWRFAFGSGAVLGVIILAIRHFVPESPRWLMTHGREREADDIVRGIEDKLQAQAGVLPRPEGSLRLCVRKSTPFRQIWHAMAIEHRRRTLLGLALMIAQAFFYNGVFFTYGLVLLRFYGVSAANIGWYVLPLALGNFLGPLLIGKLFDSVGRKPMITITYALSGALLLGTALLFRAGWLTTTTQTIAWMAIFFVGSAASSSAYLTVSEIFPLEIRAVAIAIFYACGTLAGGVGAPALFGLLIGTGSRGLVSIGYFSVGLVMLGAATVELLLGVKAERRSLESITRPLSCET